MVGHSDDQLLEGLRAALRIDAEPSALELAELRTAVKGLAVPLSDTVRRHAIRRRRVVEAFATAAVFVAAVVVGVLLLGRSSPSGTVATISTAASSNETASSTPVSELPELSMLRDALAGPDAAAIAVARDQLLVALAGLPRGQSASIREEADRLLARAADRLAPSTPPVSEPPTTDAASTTAAVPTATTQAPTTTKVAGSTTSTTRGDDGPGDQ